MKKCHIIFGFVLFLSSAFSWGQSNLRWKMLNKLDPTYLEVVGRLPGIKTLHTDGKQMFWQEYIWLRKVELKGGKLSQGRKREIRRWEKSFYTPELNFEIQQYFNRIASEEGYKGVEIQLDVIDDVLQIDIHWGSKILLNRIEFWDKGNFKDQIILNKRWTIILQDEEIKNQMQYWVKKGFWYARIEKVTIDSAQGVLRVDVELGIECTLINEKDKILKKMFKDIKKRYQTDIAAHFQKALEEKGYDVSLFLSPEGVEEWDVAKPDDEDLIHSVKIEGPEDLVNRLGLALPWALPLVKSKIGVNSIRLFLEQKMKSWGYSEAKSYWKETQNLSHHNKVVFTIQPGDISRVKNIEISEDVSGLIASVFPQVPFALDSQKKLFWRQNSASILLDHGYLGVNVDLTYHPQSETLSVHWKSSQFSVLQDVIWGDYRMQSRPKLFHQHLNYIKSQIGQRFGTDNIREIENRIMQDPVFGYVRIQQIQLRTQSDKVFLIIHTEPPGGYRWLAGLGWDSQDKFRVKSALHWRWSLTPAWEYFQQFEISGRRVDIRLGVEDANAQPKWNVFLRTASEFRFSEDKKLHDLNTWEIRASYKWYKPSWEWNLYSKIGKTTIDRSDDFNWEDVIGNRETDVFALGFGINRKVNFNQENRHRVWFNVEQAAPFAGMDADYGKYSFGLGKKINFYKPGYSASVYVEMGGFFTKANVPIQERFFLGGLYSFRAYPQDTLGPVWINDNGYEPVGGTQFGLVQFEFSMPIWGDIGLTFFYDGGNVWNSVGDHPEVVEDEVGDMHWGPGIQLWYKTPLGRVFIQVARSSTIALYENEKNEEWGLGFQLNW